MSDLDRIKLEIAFWGAAFSIGWIIAELIQRFMA